MRRNTAIAFGCVLFLAAAGLGATFVSSVSTRPADDAMRAFFGQSTIPQKIESWRNAIRKMGGEAAYEELLTRAAALPNEKQHALGHYFGRALYEEKGLSGFSVCDEGLLGGCMHEFVAAAVQANGMDVLQQLGQDCLLRTGNDGTTCQHGIGHGVMNYLGYTEADLSATLDACKSLNSNDPTKGCYGGSLMEFNVHTMADNKERPFEADRPYAPCDKISAEYTSACYFWLPQWIHRAKHLSKDLASFKIMGAYCGQATPATNAESCFRGLGYEASPATEFDYKKTKALCDAVSERQTDRDACWSIASQTLPVPAE